MMFSAIETVLGYIESLNGKISADTTAKQILTLIQILPGAIDEIQVHKNSTKNIPFKNKIKLCASQLTKALPLLGPSSTSNPSCKERVEFLIEKIRWCLLEVLRVFNGGSIDSDTDPGGIFVKSMDCAIKYIQDDRTVDNEFKEFIDDLLCQSLTIAKLAAKVDYEEIAFHCKNVLVKLSAMMSNEKCTLESMKKELLLSSLEDLERKVNIAVLRMLLHTLSDVSAPIKAFNTKCIHKTGPRLLTDLNPEIAQMDDFYDRIQTIGNFAVACCENSKMKLEVQSCLASLEFIENHFVTAVSAVYMDQDNIVKKNFLSFLINEITKEIKELQTYLDNIVDSSAFTQVVYDDLNTLGENIKLNINDGGMIKDDLETFAFRCTRLLKHIKSTDDPFIKNNIQLYDILSKFEKSIAQFQLRIQSSVIPNLEVIAEEMEQIVSIIYRILEILAKPSELTYSFSSVVRGIRNKTIESTPVRDSNLSGLEPYLAKVAETPRKLTLFIKTPSKFTPKVDRQLSFNITDVLERLSGLSGTFYERDRPQNELEAAFQQFNESSLNYNTAHRLEDLNYLERKISEWK